MSSVDYALRRNDVNRDQPKDAMPKPPDLLDKVPPKNRPTIHAVGSEHIQAVAGKGLHDPKRLTDAEIRELCGSVLAHPTKRAR